jgi:GWxTD domain-containing protein
MDLSVSLADSTGQVVAEETWTRNVSIESPAGLREASAPFRDVIGFDMIPGDYGMRLSIEDIYGDHQGSCSGLVRVRDLEGERLSASDLLFASELGESGQNGRFDRYSWKVVPNTTRSYLAGSPVRYYFEVYNVEAGGDREKDTFILGCSLVDSSGVPIKRYPAKRVPKRGESVVVADSLDTAGIEGGAYYVQVEAFDRGTREHFRARRGVRLISPAGPVELTKEQKDQVRYYKTIRFVAAQKDLKVYQSLKDDETKMRFLKAFWRKLDPTPETPTNERLIEHMRRMRYADDHFSGGHNQRGSETEKGRIYIKYGPPDDIEYNTAAAGSKAYEKWIYERQGRYDFIFQDTRGIGVYEVVHTTYPGELPFNPDWQFGRTPVGRGRY